MRFVILISALLASLPGVQAQGRIYEEDTGWFIAGFGGVSLQRDQTSQVFDAVGLTLSGEATAFADFETGIAVGVRVGYAFPSFETALGPVQLRFALDHLYRENDISSLDLVLDGAIENITTLSGDQSSNAFHGLGIIEFRGGGRIVPYIGVGAGVAGVESDVLADVDLGAGPIEQAFGGTVDAEFSYEILGGLIFRLTRSIEVMIEGRFIDVGDPTFDLTPAGGGAPVADFDSEFSHFNILAGVQFTF